MVYIQLVARTNSLESVSTLFFSFVNQNYPMLIFLLVFAFLFASFNRVKIFHYNTPAQTIVSIVLAIGTAGIIQSVHWDNMTKVIAAVVAGGIVSMVIWSVALQRGKTSQEVERKWEQERVRAERREDGIGKA